MTATPELHAGNGIILRPLRNSDTDLMEAMFSDAEVVRFSRINPLSRDEAHAMLLRWLEPENDAYWSVHDSSGKTAGVIFLRNVNSTHRAAEIGYMLVRDSWGKGIASAIVTAVIRHGFGTMGLCRIEAYVSTPNRASLRVLEKCGFQQEGRRRADVFKNGRFEDSILCSRINETLIRNLEGARE